MKTKKARLPASQGSILAYSLIILAMMTIIAVSLSTTSAISKKSAGSTNSSTQSLQTADSAVQLTKQTIGKDPLKPIKDAFEPCDLSTGVAQVTETISGSGSYKLSLYADQAGNVPIVDCTEPANSIQSVKAVATDNKTVRAVFASTVGPCGSISSKCGVMCSYFGDIYSTVDIEGQCWFAENVRTTKKPDGSPITEGIWCYDQDVDGNGGSCGSPWGRLYSWATIMNYDTSCNYQVCNSTNDQTRGICPPNWHVPSDENWMTLEHNLGMCNSPAGTGKCTNDEGPNRGVDVSPLTVAEQLQQGDFKAISVGNYGDYTPPAPLSFDDRVGDGGQNNFCIWSSTENNTNPETLTVHRDMYYMYGDDSLGVSRGTNPKEDGASLRCMHD